MPHDHQAHGVGGSKMTVIDPVCGMTVDPSKAAGSHVHQGHTYHFCSTHCLSKFKADPDRFIAPMETHVDPICGMTVDESSPLRVERDGQSYYFCSEHCRQKFIGQTQPGHASSLPVVGIGGGSAPPVKHAHAQHHHQAHTVEPSAAAKYFCPMCPGVESDKPGDCPKCGMALERNPAWTAPAAGKVIYTCPMHPEVQQDQPGDCPICGMALEPMTAAVTDDEDDNGELHDMTRRLWIGAAFTLPVFVLAMAHLVPVPAVQSWGDSHASRWIQFLLTTPVVAWAGWPFFDAGGVRY
ncbi:MAG: YHS domain-containing protein [Planctomycetota bacterium]|nr:YHS domain-containing protein [Planctomycetota bacterium]